MRYVRLTDLAGDPIWVNPKAVAFLAPPQRDEAEPDQDRSYTIITFIGGGEGDLCALVKESADVVVGLLAAP